MRLENLGARRLFSGAEVPVVRGRIDRLYKLYIVITVTDCYYVYIGVVGLHLLNVDDI